MKVYLSGPITGIEDFNRKAFDEAEKIITDRGYEAINPHKVCSGMPSESSYDDYMLRCMIALMDCQGIHMLDGWEKSKGSRIERKIARACDIVEV